MNSSRWAALLAAILLGTFLGLGKVALLVYHRLNPVVAEVSPSPSVSRSPELVAPSSPSAQAPSPSREEDTDEPVPPPVSVARPKIRYTATNPPVQPPLKLNHVQQGREFDVYVENQTTCPLVARVDFVQQSNCRANPRLPRDVALRGKQKLRVTTISGARYYDAFSFRYNVTRWMVGIPNARHAPTAVYHLPFAGGSTSLLRLERDSVGPTYTWDVPEDTPVLCARRGKVVYTEQRYGVRSEDFSYFMKTNRVVVLHQDNTLGYYDHLRPQGVAVAVGQVVEPGTLLGYSGETGVCRGPCLTFFVLKAVNAASFRTFELRFDVEGDGRGQALRNGCSYTVPDY